MRERRNPFHLRAAERIVPDAMFLRLYGPKMLDVLPKDISWDLAHILRSSRGAGKSSLMRLFTPSALQTLHANRSGEEYRELYQRMQALGALDENGPSLLGIYLNCRQNYSNLGDLALDTARQQRLFFSLLNARIVLALFQSALSLAKLDFPSDLNRLTLENGRFNLRPFGLTLPATGLEVYSWANQIEADVCEALDSFDPLRLESLPGHDTLLSLHLLDPSHIRVDGHQIASHAVLMLDDVHYLTSNQRDQLVKTVVEQRGPIAVWVAERFEALQTEEMLATGAAEGRDYGESILPEVYWHTSRNNRGNTFETLVQSIADRRVRSAPDGDLGSFRSFLNETLDGPEWHKPLAAIIETVRTRIMQTTEDHVRFKDWVRSRETISGSLLDQAIAWRTLEILIEREKRHLQMRFEWELTVEELETRDIASVREAARLFLSNEFSSKESISRLPYYFGSGRVTSAASWNIEQFLTIAAEQFEEALSTTFVKPRSPVMLSPYRQEQNLRRVAQARWDDIPVRVPNGREVRHLLDCIGRFARWTTYRPTAPYAPGVTGIAISMRDRDVLRKSVREDDRQDYVRLAEVISAALKHNLLEARLDHSGKDDQWMVLYLNRLLCVQFDLPLQYGGWREKSLNDLNDWMERGFTPPTEGGLL